MFMAYGISEHAKTA